MIISSMIEQSESLVTTRRESSLSPLLATRLSRFRISSTNADLPDLVFVLRVWQQISPQSI